MFEIGDEVSVSSSAESETSELIVTGSFLYGDVQCIHLNNGLELQKSTGDRSWYNPYDLSVEYYVS